MIDTPVRLYKMRQPTGKVSCNGQMWYVFSLPVHVDSWQSEMQHTFLEAVNAETFRETVDGKKLYGKMVMLTLPVNQYILVQSDFEPIPVWTGEYAKSIWES